MPTNVTYLHPVSGPIRELSIGDFLALCDESVHSAILQAAARYPDRTALVCFENIDLSSSQLGHRTACVVGPSNTFRSLEHLTQPGVRLGDVPSRFQYPVAYVTQGELHPATKAG